MIPPAEVGNPCLTPILPRGIELLVTQSWLRVLHRDERSPEPSPKRGCPHDGSLGHSGGISEHSTFLLPSLLTRLSWLQFTADLFQQLASPQAVTACLPGYLLNHSCHIRASRGSWKSSCPVINLTRVPITEVATDYTAIAEFVGCHFMFPRQIGLVAQSGSGEVCCLQAGPAALPHEQCSSLVL